MVFVVWGSGFLLGRVFVVYELWEGYVDVEIMFVWIGIGKVVIGKGWFGVVKDEKWVGIINLILCFGWLVGERLLYGILNFINGCCFRWSNRWFFESLVDVWWNS